MIKFWKLYYRLIGMTPDKMEMVQYWRKGESVAAKVIKAPDGSFIMKMCGEKYPFPTFPRGHLLYGNLSRLKHEIKNQIFNESWAEKENPEAVKNIKYKLFYEIPKYFEPLKFDIIPFKNLTPSVREIYRAWTKVAPEKTFILRDYLCFILQEDDSYRMRIQWLAGFFNPNGIILRWFDPINLFEKALKMLEHAEIIGDMKERILLLRTILLLCLKDKDIKDLFVKFVREVNWKKVRLTKGDKYFFRGKYFKVDYPYLDY
ncbi:MAG: hypothetical protein HY919_02925 [Elusimicrobia bacterium]|nr:hypothetical protein [Elusimicrobiota bacterium]